MNWQAFYLGCFGVRLVLSLVSFLSERRTCICR